MLKNLALGQETLTAAAWEPGMRITGTVLAADSTPVANTMLVLGTPSQRQLDARIYARTDKDGCFTTQGLLPGNVLVALFDAQKPGGWTVTLPEQETVELTLKAARRVGLEEFPMDGITHAWWVPAQGEMRQLPVINRGAYTYDTLDGEGAIWLITGGYGSPRLVPFSPAKGVQKLRDIDMAMVRARMPGRPKDPHSASRCRWIRATPQTIR